MEYFLIEKSKLFKSRYMIQANSEEEAIELIKNTEPFSEKIISDTIFSLWILSEEEKDSILNT